MKKILISPNSFKECSHSTQVADYLEKILLRKDKLGITKLPISDGGDGFLGVCNSYFNLEILSCEVTKPYSNELFTVSVGYSKQDKKLYIESAEVIGLRRIPLEKRHPLSLNSKGLGELLKFVIESGLIVDKVILGIGGTGTSDLGLGTCSVFGLKLFDFFDKEAEIFPGNFISIKSFSWPKIKLPFEMELLVDVDNQLLGPNGTASAFAEQKGATKGEVEILNLGFNKIIKLFKNNNLIDSVDNLSGAGGGLAAGMQIFFDAKIIRAKDFINSYLQGKIDEYAPDFVITGEGVFDDQTLMGKGAKIVIENCISRDIPVFLVCGKIDKNSIRTYGKKIIPIELQAFFKNQKESIENFHKGLEFACEKIINYIF